MFPNLITYEPYNQMQDRLFIPLLLYLNDRTPGKCTGISFVDSTTFSVCLIKREKQRKVFMEKATKSKRTMGWFFGFKLHLIINDNGGILILSSSRANKNNRDEDIMKYMVEQIFGKLPEDRDYISEKLAQYLWNNGIKLNYKMRKNIKEVNLSGTDKVLIRKGALIETVNDELKNIYCLQHTGHRSFHGFLNNL